MRHQFPVGAGGAGRRPRGAGPLPDVPAPGAAAGQRRGLVKWFNRTKGYGFITGTDGAEIFVHKSGLAAGQPLLRTGQFVQFGLAAGPRGVQAEDVTVLAMPPEADDAPGA